MKSLSLNQKTRLFLAAALGISTLLSPIVAQASEERAFGTGQHVKLALVNTQDYSATAGERHASLYTAAMEARWQKLQQTIRPDVLVKLSEEFEKDFPGSQYSQADKDIQAGARKAFQALRDARLSSGAIEEPSGDVAYRNKLTQALRGDKESAYHVAMMYMEGTHGLRRSERRAAQWLHIAAELGSADASWEVAQIYNIDGQVGEAARFEAKAVEAGYRVPARLSTRDNY